MAGTSSSPLTADQTSALQGWGTALTGGLVDRNGQTFGGGKTLDQYVQNLNAQFPGLNATIQDQTGGDSGTYIGSTVNFDQSKLPAGWQQALGGTGRIELSDPDSKWGQGQGTLIKDPNAVVNDPTWGKFTGMQNIYEQPDKITDVGAWGPLVVSAIIGGAGMGLLPGFGGMSDAAAQGLVGSATGGIGAGDASFLGMSGSKLLNTFRTLGNAALGGSKPNLGSVVGAGLGFTGLSPAMQTLARLGMSLAQNGGKMNINPTAALPYLAQLGIRGFGG